MVFILVAAFLIFGIYHFKIGTYPWDLKTIGKASEISCDFEGRPIVLSGSDLSDYLGGLEFDLKSLLEFRNARLEFSGSIVIDGKSFPAKFVDDKFTGQSIVVEFKSRKVELFGEWNSWLGDVVYVAQESAEGRRSAESQSGMPVD